MSSSQPLVSAKNLAAERGGRALFSGVDITLNRSEIRLLRGANGSGKTTLLRLLAGLSPAREGEIARADRVLFWGHAAAVKDELTPLENLKLLTANHDIPAAQFLEVLARCGLAARARVLAKRLSAGQRRRILLARLFLAQELIWLLDEPTAALDAQGLSLLSEALNAHHARGGCALIATHVDLAGLQIAPQVLEIGA